MEENVNTVLHRYLKEALNKDMVCVDATMGRGNDTFFLANLCKKVYAFDIQMEALEQSKKRCKDLNNIEYYCMSHALMNEVIHEEVDCIVFNLGYLPYSDQIVITKPESTLEALNKSYNLLKPNGILSVLCYVGHEGGKAEHDCVKHFIDTHDFDVLTYTYKTRENAPVLYYLHKKG